MAFVSGSQFPQWQGNLLVGALRGQTLVRLTLEREKVLGEERLLQGRSRLRDVRMGPDGFVYLLTDEAQGALLRLEPFKPQKKRSILTYDNEQDSSTKIQE